MKFQQRRTVVVPEKPPAGKAPKLWQPRLMREDDLQGEGEVWTDVEAKDAYVTVDERVGATICVVAAGRPARRAAATQSRGQGRHPGPEARPRPQQGARQAGRQSMGQHEEPHQVG